MYWVSQKYRKDVKYNVFVLAKALLMNVIFMGEPTKAHP